MSININQGAIRLNEIVINKTISFFDTLAQNSADVVFAQIKNIILNLLKKKNCILISNGPIHWDGSKIVNNSHDIILKVYYKEIGYLGGAVSVVFSTSLLSTYTLNDKDFLLFVCSRNQLLNNFTVSASNLILVNESDFPGITSTLNDNSNDNTIIIPLCAKYIIQNNSLLFWFPNGTAWLQATQQELGTYLVNNLDVPVGSIFAYQNFTGTNILSTIRLQNHNSGYALCDGTIVFLNNSILKNPTRDANNFPTTTFNPSLDYFTPNLMGLPPIWSASNFYEKGDTIASADHSKVWTALNNISPPPLINVFKANGGFVKDTTLIRAVAQQPDGKFVVVGNFEEYTFAKYKNIMRINPDGSIDGSLNIGLGFNGQLYDVAVQSDSKIVVCGAFTSYNGNARNRIVRLNSDGSIDTTFSIGTGFNDIARKLLISSDGIIVAGDFTSYNGTSCNRIIQLNFNGTVNNSRFVFEGHAFGIENGYINNIKPVKNNKFLMTGNFTAYLALQSGGQRFVRKCNNICKIDQYGFLDVEFINNIGSGFNGETFDFFEQSDGKVIIVGQFTQFNGNARNNIVRLNSNGTDDNTFSSINGATVGSGPSPANITSIAGLSDDSFFICGQFGSYNNISINNFAKITKDCLLDNNFDVGSSLNCRGQTLFLTVGGELLIGGCFNSYNNFESNKLIKLKLNGTIDTDFRSYIIENNGIKSIVVQPDGKILVGGDFVFYGPSNVRYVSLVRLNSNGSVDTTFNPGGSGLSYPGNEPRVYSIALQPDGKILVGGAFTFYNGQPRNHIVRLNSDGSADTSFSIGSGFNDAVNTIVVQPDGKILVGGWFTQYNSNGYNRIIRLNSNGTIDGLFSVGSGFNDMVITIAIQPDGKILVGGSFTQYKGQTRNYIVRLDSDGSDNTGSLPGQFNIGLGPFNGFNGTVTNIALQTTGHVIVAGRFTSYNSNVARNLTKLNNDGTINTAFSSGLGVGGISSPLFLAEIKSLLIDLNDNIYVGGTFKTYKGTTQEHFAKINGNNGDIDYSFPTKFPVVGDVESIALSNNQLFLGGRFNNVLNHVTHNIIRMRTDGRINNAGLTPQEPPPISWQSYGVYNVGSIVVHTESNINGSGQTFTAIYEALVANGPTNTTPFQQGETVWKRLWAIEPFELGNPFCRLPQNFYFDGSKYVSRSVFLSGGYRGYLNSITLQGSEKVYLLTEHLPTHLHNIPVHSHTFDFFTATGGAHYHRIHRRVLDTFDPVHGAGPSIKGVAANRYTQFDDARTFATAKDSDVSTDHTHSVGGINILDDSGIVPTGGVNAHENTPASFKSIYIMKI